MGKREWEEKVEGRRERDEVFGEGNTKKAEGMRDGEWGMVRCEKGGSEK